MPEPRSPMAQRAAPISLRVHADGYADVEINGQPRIALAAADGRELLLAIDAELGNCHRCDEPLWLALVRHCNADGRGPYCDRHMECNCVECRAGAA